MGVGGGEGGRNGQREPEFFVQHMTEKALLGGSVPLFSLHVCSGARAIERVLQRNKNYGR